MPIKATIGNNANGRNGETEKRKEESIPVEELLTTYLSGILADNPTLYPIPKSTLGLWISSYQKCQISEPRLMRPAIFYAPCDRERFS